jgi:hypothetical protein
VVGKGTAFPAMWLSLQNISDDNPLEAAQTKTFQHTCDVGNLALVICVIMEKFSFASVHLETCSFVEVLSPTEVI